MIGETVGNYRILSELGKGGMGVVYKAEHIQLGRPAALKMLLPTASSDPGIVRRFFTEAKAASAIDHPGIVEIYDFGHHDDGSAYIVMAFLAGESLEQRLARSTVSFDEIKNILSQVAAALAAAHAKNIVHRDLKPDNIFLVPNELMPGGIQVQLLDFGIAKLADSPASGQKTQTGVLMGTPAYMSPEQCMGASEIDHRTDLYAFGCILFHMTCGRPPFISEHGTGVMLAAHMRDPPPHPHSLNPAIPGPLVDITLRLLEKDPAARYQTATEVRAALIAAGAPGTRNPGPQPVANQPAYTPTLPAQSAHPSHPSPLPGAHPSVPAAPGGMTTHRAAAGQMQTATPATSSKKGIVIGIVATAVLGVAGVGTYFAVTGAAEEPVQPRQALATLADAGAGATKAATAPDASQPGVGDAGGVELCPDGRVRSPDTRGNCCWPDQLWSLAKSQCVGRPRCPPGRYRRGLDCRIRENAKPKPDVTGRGDDTEVVPTTKVPRFRLASSKIVVGTPVSISFDNPVSSKSGNRAWVTVVTASKPASAFEIWKYIPDGAKSVQLKSPKRAGRYEVRVHTGYPKKRFHVRAKRTLTVIDKATVAKPPVTTSGETPRSQQRFSSPSQVRLGASIRVRFPAALRAQKRERFWITVIAKSQPDSRFGTWKYVPAGARAIVLRAPRTPGDYEIRLHGNYPKKTTNVVYRRKLTVR